MHYYTFSTLIFADRKIRDAFNLLYKSEDQATIVEFRKQVEAFHAGPQHTYSGIVIPTWQEIDEAAYKHMDEDFRQWNESRR